MTHLRARRVHAEGHGRGLVGGDRQHRVEDGVLVVLADRGAEPLVDVVPLRAGAEAAVGVLRRSRTCVIAYSCSRDSPQGLLQL